MKKMLKSAAVLTAFVAIFVLCALVLPNSAQAATVDDLTYEITNGEVTITDCNEDASGKLIIPDTIEGYPVTSIGKEAFKSCTALTSVTIGNGVTSIGSYSFSRCSSLIVVTIPDSMTSIGSNAFSYCYSLTSVYITDLAAWCKINFEYGSSNPLYQANNLYLNDDLVTALVIPDRVTRIEDYAFYSCDSLTSVTIPDGVTYIGEDAFFGCDRLTTVTIPDSLTSIGYDAFSGCTNLSSVHITDLAAWCKISFGYFSNPLYYADNLYLNGELVTALVLPDSVTSIEDYAFYGCTGLTSVTIPDSVTIIGNAAFDHCYNLTNVYYSGTQIQWNNISIGTYNERLSVATLHLNHSHNYSFFEPVTVAATCTEDGYIKYTCIYGEKYCVLSPALGHDYSDPVETIQPTCETKGCTGPGCSRCDAVRPDNVVPALGHSIVAVSAVEPTCTKDGHGTGTQCQRCEKYFVEPTVTPALGHKYGKWTVTKEATATAQGSKRRNCTRCAHYETAVIPKLPAIKTQPVSANLPAGKTAKFTVKATGTGLKYQWQYRTSSKGSWKNTTATGYKTATLSVAVTAARNNYQYRCKVTDQESRVVYSNAATLKVVTLKVIAQPANKYLPAGKTAKFTVKVSGTGLKYQWQYRTSSSGSWKNASAAGNKTATLSVPATATRNGYQYRCKITDKYGNVIYSNTATLKIVTLKITTQPSSVTLAKGKTATFKVVAKGTGLTYQWQYRTSAKGSWKKASATGNKTATLKVPVTAARNGYQYRCVITDKYGNVINSSAATLKVKK